MDEFDITGGGKVLLSHQDKLNISHGCDWVVRHASVCGRLHPAHIVMPPCAILVPPGRLLLTSTAADRDLGSSAQRFKSRSRYSSADVCGHFNARSSQRFSLRKSTEGKRMARTWHVEKQRRMRSCCGRFEHGEGWSRQTVHASPNN